MRIKLRYTAAATHKPARLSTEVIATVLGMLVLMPSLVTASSISRAEQARAFLVDLQTPNNEQAQVHDRELKHKEAIEREIKGGEAHTYRVTLTAGQFLSAVVKQKTIDVVARIFGPDGQKLTEVDNDPVGGVESISVVAEAFGDYRLEVRSQNSEVAAGRYELVIEEMREATSKDRIHVAAQRIFEEGNQLRDQQTGDSLRKAIENYKKARPLWQQSEDKKREAYTLHATGYAYSRLGEPKTALEYYDQAVQLWRTLGDSRNEAESLANAGVVYWKLGEAQKALEYYNKALPSVRTVGDRQSESVLLNNIGLAYLFLGQPKQALDSFDQSLPISRVVADRRLEAITLNNIATTYHQLGDLEKTLEIYLQVLPLRRAVGDVRGESTTLHNLGLAYSQLGDLQRALKYYNQALLLTRKVGDRQYEAITLEAMSTVYQRLGDLEQALKCAEESLEISRAVGDRRQEAYGLNSIGTIYKLSNEPKKALDHFNQSLSLRRAVGDRFGESNTLSNLGNSYLAFGDPQKALEYYAQSLKLSREFGDKLGEASILYGIASAQHKMGDNLTARREIKAAIDIIEATRTKVTSQDLRTSFLASNKELYELYIELLMRMNKTDVTAGHDIEALQVSERARARSLLDMLTEVRGNIRQGVDPLLLERERSLHQQLSKKSERLTRLLGSKHTEEQETAARKDVETLLGEYQDLKAQIRTRSPHYAALTQPKTLSLMEIQQQVLDENTLLLEYSLGEEKSYLWAITSSSIKSFELPKRIEIETASRRVYDALTARNNKVRFEKKETKRKRIAAADSDYVTAAAALSEMILSPVATQLDKKRLLIVSDGALQYIPFAALPIPSQDHARSVRSSSKNGISFFRPLLTKFQIVSLPSASVLAELRKEPGRHESSAGSVAVLADPVFQGDDPRVKDQSKSDKQSGESLSREAHQEAVESELVRSAREIGDLTFGRLPFTRQEAEGILALAPQRKRMASLDFEASRSTATSSDLSRYRIIHFATHGLLNSEHPELSGIVLSLVDRNGKPQDGFLRLYETYNLKLRADLVVLSACRTALGKEIKGEGLIGLTRGFMYAGTSRVVASLWGVEDESTAELMKRFYYEMLVKRQPAAAALRTAQLWMWGQKRLPPYFWAAFILQGEWK